MKRTLAAVLLCAVMASGCKKQKAEGGGEGGGEAGQQGPGSQAGEPVGGPAKPAAGCNSDLATPLTTDTTFTVACSPYVVGSELYLDNLTLTIEPGVIVQLKEGAAIYVGYNASARLLVKGTPEKPVLFTADQHRAPGAWRAVILYSKASGSAIENAVLEYAGGSDDAALKIEGAGDVTVKGVKIVATRKRAFAVEGEQPQKELSGLDLSQAGGDPDELVSLDTHSLPALKGGNTFPQKSVIATHGNVAAETRLLAHNVPYRILGEVYVDAPEGKSASLTFEAGATVQLAESAAIYVGYNTQGALKVAGTREKPVTFTRYGEDLKTSPWRGIVFYKGARAPELEYAVFEYGGRKEDGVLRYEGPRGAGKLAHCTFRHLPGDAVHVVGAEERFTAFEDNTFEDVGDAAAELPIQLAHALGANTFSSGSVKLIGNVNEDTTLKAIGAPYRIEGEVYVEAKDAGKTATLTLEAGVSVVLSGQGRLYVGYGNPGKLVARGLVEKATPQQPAVDKPITLAGLQGAKWRGITAYGQGTVELEELTLSDVADDDYAIKGEAKSKGTLKNVTFKDVKKGLKKCGAWTTAGLKADKGVKAEEKCD